MTQTQDFDVEQGLIALPGTPTRWIWAFTCPMPECACRTAVVLSASGERETLRERGRPVQEAWLARDHYGQAAQDTPDSVAFAIDLDTLQLSAAASGVPLDRDVEQAVREVVSRLDEEVLDAVARVWHCGKGETLPREPDVDDAKIAVEGFRPGALVVWDDARPSLRGDAYVFGQHVYEAAELYCVKPACDCHEVVVVFGVVTPRGAARPGGVEFDGELASLHPSNERQRARLAELWAAYCARHPRYQERFEKRSAIMHALAGRIVAAAPKPKPGRKQRGTRGSGRKSR